MQQISLTALYVPADRPERVRKALATKADVVIIDLEDAVAPSAKAQARRELPSLLAGCQRPVQVRVNDLESPWGREDLAAVSDLDPAVQIRVPKVTGRDRVDMTRDLVGPRALHCLIETALGVERAHEVACAAGVVSIGLGEQDLRSELGVVSDRALDWQRGRIINAAAAAGLPPPAQGVYTKVRDLEGLRRWCRINRGRGFLGGAAIHPDQLPVIRECFRPSRGDVARAEAVVAALDSTDRRGAGVAVLADGSFVDAAMAGAARRTLLVESLFDAASDVPDS